MSYNGGRLRDEEAILAVEIERKFLVGNEGWRSGVASSRRLVQFYLSRNGPSSVRVRIDGGRRAQLTIKTAASGTSRAEFEYEIPLADAEDMIALAEGAVIAKMRHIVPYRGLTWEVDEFHGDNEGLVVAEVELEREDQIPELPPWLGREVTDDRRYYNASLALQPFNRW